MGKIIKKRIEYGGSSNSAENIKYDDNKNVKEAINEVKSEIADINSNLGMKLLWENHNSYSSFDAQTVELSSNDYDFVDIYFRFYASETTESRKTVLHTRILNGTNGVLFYASYPNYACVDTRMVDCQTNGKIIFYNASRNGTTRNDILIPYKIYGGKFK